MDENKYTPKSGREHLTEGLLNEIDEGEILGGVNVNKIPVGKGLLVRTKSREYKLEHRQDGWYISGHPKFCPEPTLINVQGALGSGSMIALEQITRGQRLEVWRIGLPMEEARMVTSRVEDIEEISL